MLLVLACMLLPVPVLAAGSDSGQMQAAAANVSPVLAAGTRRVFDDAGLFTQDQIKGFEEQVENLRDTMKMDVVLVTAKETGGRSAQQYADDFYDNGGFGTRSDYSGVLFLIDMDNRELLVSTSGAMIRFVTDKRREAMYDRAYICASAGDYAGVMGSFLAHMEEYYRAGIPGGQYNYDAETGAIHVYRSIRWYEGLIALAVAAFCAAGACLNVKREYAMKQERGRASGFNLAYRADAQFVFGSQSDMLVDSNVTRSVMPRNTGGRMGGSGGGFGGSTGGAGRSTTHTSSSGRVHGGGGGRKF